MKICTHKMMQEEGIPYLVKETTYSYPLRDKIDTPKSVAELMRDVFKIHQLAEEYVYVLCMNAAGSILDVFEVSHGTVNSSTVNPREVMLRVLLAGATNILLVHNHPAGTIVPSHADEMVTERMKEVCLLMGISLLDHIIIGGNNSFSFHENNML